MHTWVNKDVDAEVEGTRKPPGVNRHRARGKAAWKRAAQSTPEGPGAAGYDFCQICDSVKGTGRGEVQTTVPIQAVNH